MSPIKRTSPGPKIGPVGSSIGAPKGVGTTGPDKTSVSSKGGQHPFMPAEVSTRTHAKDTPGQTSSGRVDSGYSFLPKKAGGK
jgi:hypothetical protein